MGIDHSDVSRDVHSDRVEATRLASVGWHIQRLAAQLDVAMNRQLAPHGLTIQQFALVMTAVESDGISQVALTERFSAPAYAISRALDQLERDGFIERRPHPTSRRVKGVHATPQTRALVPQLVELIGTVNDRLADGLSSTEREALLGLLKTCLSTHRLADI